MPDLSLSCPACSARYVLPASLIGEAGAAVRCPACAHEFSVDPTGRPLPPGEDPLRVLARDLIDALDRRLGFTLAAAARQRRLFADHGPALLEAWEEYRRRAGANAGSRPFRDELRERFGIELFPPGAE